MSEETDSDTIDLEENVEPIFKYMRIGNYLLQILNKETLTCVAVHEKFLVFGTSFGHIHLILHGGNRAKLYGNRLQRSCRFHSVAVNQIAIDSKGEYIASCADDGKIFIIGLLNEDSDQEINIGKPINCIALDSKLSYSSCQRFIIGGEHLTLYEKGFLKSMKPTQLNKGDGPVSAISWNNQFVAWASNFDVRVYDLNEKCSLGVFKWEELKNDSLNNFRCNLRWADSNTLLIGWGDVVRIWLIRKRNSIDASTRLYPAYIVETISTFSIQFYISGLAPLAQNQLVLMGYPKEKNELDNQALRPILCVISYSSNVFESLTTDTLSLRGYEKYKVNDYFLEYVPSNSRFIIMAKKDVVVAMLLDIDDKVKWLIEHKKFEQALETISTNNVDISYVNVAKKYVAHLLSMKQYNLAAKVCSTTFGNDKSLWEEEVYNFGKHQELRSISAYLPCSTENKLGPQVYEMVLFEYLTFQKDAKGFLNLIKQWNPELYNVKAVINVINENFYKENENELLEALAILYTHKKDYKCALKLYLKIKNKEVFNLIENCQLYSSIYDMAIPLLELDKKKAALILVNKNVSAEKVYAQLEKNEQFLFEYLKDLVKVNSEAKYHSKLVELYAKFERHNLLRFLKRSNNYPIQNALDICKKMSFDEEMVYLLERIGNSSEALSIIVHKLKNIEEAIEFCKRIGDCDLWNDLIKESLENPELIPQLLNNIAGYVNPEILVEKIKSGQDIPDLKKSLVKMLKDYSLQMCIQESYKNVVVTDYFNVHEKLVKKNHSAVYVNYDNKCSYCDGDIIKNEISEIDLIVFNCHHYFHINCLPTQNKCIICKK